MCAEVNWSNPSQSEASSNNLRTEFMNPVTKAVTAVTKAEAQLHLS